MSIEITASALAGALLAALRAFIPAFDIADKIIKNFFYEDDQTPKQDAESVDERIKKIDIAKENLLEGLKAIEELKSEAQDNKKELQEALDRLAEIAKEKSLVEADLKTIKSVLSADVNSFQRLIGQPNQEQINRERIVGFVVGVISSLFASLLIYLCTLIWHTFF